MEDSTSLTVNKVLDSLCKEESSTLLYLCADMLSQDHVKDLRGALVSFIRQRQTQMGRAQASDGILKELMFRMKRFDILKKLLGTNRHEVEDMLKNGGVLSEYRVLMADLSENLEMEDLRSLIFLLGDTVPRRRLEKATSFLDVVTELEKIDELSCEKLNLIEKCLRDISRLDLAKKVQAYQRAYQRRAQSTPVCCSRQNCITQQQLPCSQETLQTPVQETGMFHSQASMEEYDIDSSCRGLCVVIDCVGSDGEMLKNTFECLRFNVEIYKMLHVEETVELLTSLAQRENLQGSSVFVCCFLSRGSNTHLTATNSRGSGLGLDDLRQLFSPIGCPALLGRPKLFFIQCYSDVDPQPQPLNEDEYLETDGVPFHAGNSGPVATETRSGPAETIPEAADVLWSMCRADAQLLERGDHHSVYLQALSSALVRARERSTQVLHVLTEVNRDIYEHNQRNPGEAYHVSLHQTLRKSLYL
ncbi:CASP8 and FADD-like apoptosis regulator a [Chanos chanos]|uniref:CASP8 and FADD-like apoptosis regulator a n=1 Tax=Chanos chanos TaxID=29144 RepID=A0A6J2V4N4_CHACN|nr:CASP8 and FADD-like apoptosis regulator [Chanos chanos]